MILPSPPMILPSPLKFGEVRVRLQIYPSNTIQMTEMQREFHDFDPSSHTRKHKIYISHSKKDCSYFARLLAAELQSMSYDAFLFENTDREAAITEEDYCLVVLSEQFFKTHSLMGELEAFVDSKASLLPVLSHAELKNPRRRAMWKEWHGFMQEKDWAQDKTANWERAMEKLGSCDGINYDSGSLMGYTQDICKAVCERVPLQVYWSKKLSDIGTSNLIQICKVAHKWFDNPSALHGGAQVVGVHGVWGVGKAILGKALCNFYSSEFGGRVCYVKLRFPPQIESSILKLERIKKVLRKLMGMSQYFLEEHVKDLDQAYTYLDQCFDETPRKVFLVVDNVEDSWESQEEAAYFFLNHSPFSLGSKVLVLARSPHTLLKLLWPLDNLCRSIKSFEHLISSQLAKNMFLKALGGLPESKDKQSVEENTSSGASMICKQLFQAHKFILQEHMHPLFFVSLGHFLRQKNSDFWHSSVERLQSKEHLKKPLMEDDFPLNGLFKMVFDVLQETQETYDSLEPIEQEVFLDVALYMPRKEVLWVQQLYDQSSGEMFSAAFKCLRKLRAIAFLRTENRMIEVHKLCKLYATMVLTKGRTLYIEGEIKWGHLQKTIGGSAGVLERIAFENCIFETAHPFIIDLSACDRVRVLRMCGIYSQGVVQIELGSIKLRSLDLCSNHAPILISGDLSYLKCLAGGAETLSSRTISLAWTSPAHCGDIFESLKVLKLSKGPAYNSLTSKDLKQYCVGSKLEVLWLNCIPFSGALQLDAWSRLKELTVCNIDPGFRELEGLKQLHSLRMLHLLYVKSLQRLPGLESLKKLKNIHVIGCKDLGELKLPGSKLLTHCCIWKCKNLKTILFEKIEEVEYSFEDDVEEDIDEITRFPYDGKSENVPPCWECLDEFVCCGGDLDDSFQDRYKEYMSRKQEKGLIYSSDENKFFVYGCTKLEEVMGLSELTSINEFILREQQYRIARLQVVRPEFLDFLKLYYDTEGQTFRLSYLKFVDAARLTHLTCLSVQDVKVKGFVQELLKQLEAATTLKSLLVRCDVSGKCECCMYTPDFSFLSKDLAELTYSCCCVDDLASIGECTGLNKISLVNCIGVKKWPDFSQLSLLSSVNMGALVLPDRLIEGQSQKSEDIEPSSWRYSRLRVEDPEDELQKSEGMGELSSHKQKSEEREALSSPKRQLEKNEDREVLLSSKSRLQESEDMDALTLHKGRMQKSEGLEKSEDMSRLQKSETLFALTLQEDQMQKSERMRKLSSRKQKMKKEILGPSYSWHKSPLQKSQEGIKALTWQKTEYMGPLSSPDCWTRSLDVDHRECHGLAILTLPEKREKDSHQHGDSVSKCYSMTWEWLGLHSMPWQELVKASQPGLDDLFRIAPFKVDDFPSDSTSQKMVLGGFFSKTSRNIHLCRRQKLSALCRTLEGKWRLAMLDLSWIPARRTLSTSGIVLKGKDFDWKFNLDDHIANDDGKLVIRGGFFSTTSKEIGFENGILRALCQKDNGHWKWNMLDLDLYITNNDGTLQSREEDGQLGVTFMSSCHNITLSNTTVLHGYARCRDFSWKRFRVNLDYNVENQDGHLVWLASPHIY